MPLETAVAPDVRPILLLDLVNRQPLLALAHAGLGVVIGLVLGDVVPGNTVVLWLIGLYFVQGLRLALWRRVKRDVLDPERMRHGARMLTLFSGLSGIVWGAGAWLLYVPGQLLFEVFYAFVLAGLISGAVISLPQHTPTFFAFVIPAIVPFVVRLALMPDDVHRALGGLALLFGGVIKLIGWQQHRSLRRSAELHSSNAALVAELAVARRELERRVHDRTAALKATTRELEHEIEERLRNEEHVRHLMHHDPLTNLPNRSLLRDRIEQGLARARRSGDRLAVMMIDLDRFTEVNETLGHTAGDELLRTLAGRLTATVRATDTVARVGGDEFALVQTDIVAAEDALRLGQRTHEALGEMLRLEGLDVQPQASIGAAIFPEHGGTASELLRHAEAALYQVKHARRAGFAFYDPALDSFAREHRQLERELRAALSRPEIFLAYQPRFSLPSRRPIGVEALVRWINPRRGLLMPSAFVPLAESTGLINELGARVLREACLQARTWLRAGVDVRTSVNLSPLQLRDPNLHLVIERTLEETGLEPDGLELEVTESVYMEPEGGPVSETLSRIRALGVAVAIDDFGTGYSSLAYLKDLPFDVVKIDRRFVQALNEDTRNEAIVAAVVALARSLDKRVVAEGVETEAQLSVLAGVGCHEAQGYLLARPAPPTELNALLGTAPLLRQ